MRKKLSEEEARQRSREKWERYYFEQVTALELQDSALRLASCGVKNEHGTFISISDRQMLEAQGRLICRIAESVRDIYIRLEAYGAYSQTEDLLQARAEELAAIKEQEEYDEQKARATRREQRRQKRVLETPNTLLPDNERKTDNPAGQ